MGGPFRQESFVIENFPDVCRRQRCDLRQEKQLLLSGLADRLRNGASGSRLLYIKIIVLQQQGVDIVSQIGGVFVQGRDKIAVKTNGMVGFLVGNILVHSVKQSMQSSDHIIVFDVGEDGQGIYFPF